MELEAGGVATNIREANPCQRAEQQQLRCRHDNKSQEDDGGGSCLLFRSLQQHIEEGHPIGLFVITQAPPPDFHYRHADGKRLPNPSANLGHYCQMKDHCREDLCHGSDSDSTTWNSAAGCNSMRRIHATRGCTMMKQQQQQQQARNPSASELFLGQVGDLRSVTETAYELDKKKSSCRHRNLEDASPAEEEEGMQCCDIDQDKMMVEGDCSVVLSEEAAASKENPLYALRRNPKRSLRLVEEEYAAAARLELTAAQALVDRPPKKAYTCSECLKEFPSGKALFGHMRCHPEREWRGIQPPAADYDSEFKGMSLLGQAGRKKQCRASNAGESESHQSRMKVAAAKDESDSDSIEAAYVNHEVDGHRSKNHNWMTGRRSRRSRQQRSQVEGEIKDEKDMANCLVMLACDTTRAAAGGGLPLKRTPSCASANSHEDKKNKFGMVDSEGDDEADWLESGGKKAPPESDHEEDTAQVVGKYSCATCKRVFKSHQALGGHRASHKKVKGCFARTSSSLGNTSGSSSSRANLKAAATATTTTTTTITTVTTLEEAPAAASVTKGVSTSSSRSRSKAGHECSVCHRVFATGQALGGHKRCHWGGTGSSSDVTNLPRCSSADYKNNPADAELVVVRRKREELFLDLNLPPPQEDEQDEQQQQPVVDASQDNSMASCDTSSTSSSSLREQQGKAAWVAVAAADYSTYLPPPNNTSISSLTRAKRIS